MKKLMLFFVVIVGIPRVFAECNVDSKIIAADYIVKQTSHQKEKSQFGFFRKDKEVAYQYKDKNITEVWNLVANGKIRPVRYFDDYKKGIEYQPGEVFGGDKRWSSKYQIIPELLLKTMKKVDKTGRGCELVETYELKQGDTYYHLGWYPHYQLPKFYSVKSKKNNMAYKLNRLVLDKQEIESFFTEKLSYRTTDYADIGDNESDPFLRKMINLGFVSHGASGIYNAAGEAMPLQGSHGHQH